MGRHFREERICEKSGFPNEISGQKITFPEKMEESVLHFIKISDMASLSYSDIAGMIDHSLLSPQLTDRELEQGIALARRYQVASVCILPYALPMCVEQLAGSGVRSSTTIGFPHGGQAMSLKVAETEQAITAGCQELDAVVNISLVRSERWDLVTRELQAIIERAHAAACQVKIIFENCFLDRTQKIRLCEICGELRADWVKTSTGYGSGGATRDDVQLMRQHSPEFVQVKAAGGIRDLPTLLQMRSAGATRIGASQTARILDEFCRENRLSLR